MTLAPEKIGDKGQRYLVQMKDYPKPGWQDVGYSDTYPAALRLKAALLKAPTCTGGRVIDREG